MHKRQMEELSDLLSEITRVKNKFDKKIDENRFNIFTALHKEHDEVNLHSRFISYLLSPNSGHGMNTLFGEVFVREILAINEKEFDLNNYEVLPSEGNKKEYKEIDILLVNKSSKQAIIIENKIGAPPSDHEDAPEGYKGQLERYYNTIKTGKDKNGNYIGDFQSDRVYIYYLSLKTPPIDELKVWNKQIFSSINYLRYDDHIIKWLEAVISLIPDDRSTLKDTITQYLKLIQRMTHNGISKEKRLELKDEIAKNWSSSKYLIDNFKHVKWHTVHEFMTSLLENINKKYDNAALFPDDFEKAVTEVTHKNKNVNFGILFDIEPDKKAYISGSGYLSWGIVEPKKWTNFNGQILENISFSDFSTDNTFRLIDNQNIEGTVDLILKEIKAEKEDDFINLKNG